MTRFNNNARLQLNVQKSQKPFEQVVGLYNMWQSLSPRTRDRIAGLFRSERPESAHADTTAAMLQSPEGRDLFLKGWDYSLGDLSGRLAEGDRIAANYTTGERPDGTSYQYIAAPKFERGFAKKRKTWFPDEGDVDGAYEYATRYGDGFGIGRPELKDEWTSIDPSDTLENSGTAKDNDVWEKQIERAKKAAERLGKDDPRFANFGQE